MSMPASTLTRATSAGASSIGSSATSRNVPSTRKRMRKSSWRGSKWMSLAPSFAARPITRSSIETADRSAASSRCSHCVASDSMPTDPAPSSGVAAGTHSSR